MLSNLQRESLDSILKNIHIKPITPYTLKSISELEKELTLTKERGYALDQQEHSLGLQCIAVPIVNLHSQCVAAISVSCPVATISKETLGKEVLEKLQETGKRISAAMGYIPT